MNLAALILIMFAQLAAAPTTFDLSADFSFATIPTKSGSTDILQPILLPPTSFASTRNRNQST